MSRRYKRKDCIFGIMRNGLSITWNSFKMAMRELRVNKFRTFLSLFGITIGIFCIIGVMSSVSSLDKNIQKDLKTIGNNTIFISKWQWGSGNSDYPWWKYVGRPASRYEETELLLQRSPSTKYACYAGTENVTIENNNQVLYPVSLYSVGEAFIQIQDVTIGEGRYISSTEFAAGSPVCLIGYENAVSLFGSAASALQKQVMMKGKPAVIIGVFKRYGRNILQGWDYDHCAVAPFTWYRKQFSTGRTEPFIMAKPKNGVATADYLGELRGAMRGIRKIAPGENDNFSLNDINVFADRLQDIFVYVQLGGAVIALFSLIVGTFGVANIMFVTVKERTPLIGLKKALGASKTNILAEFLIESAFLCVAGGLAGLVLLRGAIIFLSKAFGFEVFISPVQVILTIVICVVLGIISGFVPARQAARMDPVNAIRK
jgi:putative ABC transport system permease protein